MLLQYSDVMRLQVKVDEHYSYQDVASVMAITDCYSTAEPHVDAVCDVYIQKIGPHYRAYVYVNPVIALSRHGHWLRMHLSLIIWLYFNWNSRVKSKEPSVRFVQG